MDEKSTEEDYNIMIDNWISIEDEEEVLDAICEEEMEELENIIKPAAIDKADDDNEPEPMEVDVDGSDTFSYVEAVEVIRKLEQSAPKLGVNEAATIHLDCFLRFLHSGNAKKPKQDTTLHAYFAKD